MMSHTVMNALIIATPIAQIVIVLSVMITLVIIEMMKPSVMNVFVRRMIQTALIIRMLMKLTANTS